MLKAPTCGGSAPNINGCSATDGATGPPCWTAPSNRFAKPASTSLSPSNSPPPSNANTTTTIYGVIGRNNDNGIRYLRGKDTNQGGETWALVENQFLSQPILTRSAANSPAYTFVAYPGGLALNGSGRKISDLPNLNITTTVTGATAATDATLYVVYST